MAHVRIWRFRPLPGRLSAFEAAYGPEGDWARLFGSAAGFQGTELLRGPGAEPDYFTLDRWASRGAWEHFLRERAGEYAALDRRCEELTAREEELGSGDTAPATGGS